MQRLSFDCEELLHWWEPKTDLSFIFNFNWSSLQELREAITIFLSSRLHSVAQRAAQAITETGCPRLKCTLASNPQTPADMLDYLCLVSPLKVIIRIAENPGASRDTLSRLAFHSDSEVRSAVADNPSTPESCFKRLMNDESVDVRFRIAENPSAPLASLYALIKDDNPYVSNRAKQTLSRIINETIAVSSKMMESETELRPDLVREANPTRLSKQVIEELNQICGCDIVPLEFSVPETPV